MLRNSLLLMIFVLVFIVSLKGQINVTLSDSIYKVGVTAYESGNLDQATESFEKAIVYNPRNKDALFNLATINLSTGNKDKAISLFQQGARLRDADAIGILKNELGVKIEADTMTLSDVDATPKVLVKGRAEDVSVKNGLNKFILKTVLDGFKKSKILKDAIKDQRIFLALNFGKDGRMNAKIIGELNSLIVQTEIDEIVKEIKIIPAQYNGRNVACIGFVLPITVEYVRPSSNQDPQRF